MASDVPLSNSHPFALELASLQEAVTHFQGEAHRATVQLRHQSLEHATLLQQLHALENENSYLRTELQVHRAAGPVGEHRDALQVQELTLALRRLSDKLDLTEKVLLERNEELVAVSGERDAARKLEVVATETVKQLRSEVAAGHARERDLASRAKASEEQRRMTDLVVEEYASLVRSLEGRPSSTSRRNGESARNSLDGLMHARQGLQKLLQDSNNDTGQLHTEIERLHDLLESTRGELEVERAMALEHKQVLARIQLEIHQLRRDDNSAAKMVSRYMKFSQSSTDLLHGTIEKLKARQEAIVASYGAQLQQSDDRLASERRHSEMLRRALDELTEDISREAYGRRREIALRLALLEREEMLIERLRRWLLKSHEALQRSCSSEDEKDPETTFGKILEEAQHILAVVDGAGLSESDSSSSAARLIAAHSAVKALRAELQRETDKRLYFEYQLANSHSDAVRHKALVAKALGVVVSGSTTSCISTQPELSADPSGSDSSVVSSRDIHPNGSTGAPGAHIEREEAKPDNTSRSAEPGSPIRTENTLPLDAPRPASPSYTSMPNSAVTDSASKEYEIDGRSSFPTQINEVSNGTPAETPEQVEQHVATNLTDTEQTTNSGRDDKGPVSASQISSVEVKIDSDVRADPVGESSLSQLTENNGEEVAIPTRGAPVEEQAETGKSPPLPRISIPQEERYRSPSGLQLGISTSETPSTEDNSKATLLSRLADVDERYDDMQRSFRDCHLALQDLKRASTGSPNSNMLNIAIERLGDYCEDARVELEIRISDEERIAKGFQTLLSVPGALSDEVNEQEVMRQIEAFLDGTDAAVQRSQEILKRKLDDLEHDIASIKYAMHNPASPTPAVQEFQEQTNVHGTSSWTSWTGSILGSSRTPSPAPSFGAVMTSPRLRHSSSTRSLRGEAYQNPLANLRLRIPMPGNFHQQVDRPPSPTKQRTRPNLAPNVFGLGLRGAGMMSRPSMSMASNRSVSTNLVPTEHAGDVDSDID